MSPNAATIGGSAPRVMQDVVPPYAKALHKNLSASVMAADEPAPMPAPQDPTPAPQAPVPTPPAEPMPQAPEIPQPQPPSTPQTPTQPQAELADVPVAHSEEPAQPMFPQVQADESQPQAAEPLAFKPKPQAANQAIAHHGAKFNSSWLVVGLAVIITIALAAAAVSAMHG